MWVITGDGDALSIGGNHLLHALRRNVNLTIILFNNQIYGLTKGQYSPTSETGKVTKSTPFGSLDHPYNPMSLALGAEATFVARTHDMDRKHMMETFRRAYEHQGASFVEVYQNCNVFNDGAFELITVQGRPAQDAHPARRTASRSASGPKGSTASSSTTASARVVEVAEVGEDALLVHDEHRAGPEPGLRPVPAGQPARPTPTPIGVFRDVERPDYGSLVNQQLVAAAERRGPRGSGRAAHVRLDLDRELSSPEFADSRNTGRFRD